MSIAVLVPRKWYRKGDTYGRTLRRGYTIPLSSLIIENCQFINNTSDELYAITHFSLEYCNCGAICSIETCLKRKTPDSETEPIGFKILCRIYVWFCCSGRIPRLSLNQHSLYVGVVKKPPPPPLTGEQYGKMEPKYPEGGHCQCFMSSGFFNGPLYFK